MNATGGFASYDNSTVYLEGAPGVVTGNTFVTSLNQFAFAAVELHGSRGTISNNSVNNYATFLNVSPTTIGFTADVVPNDLVVANNSVTCAQSAISLWPTSDSSQTLRNVTITGNIIHVCNKTRSDASLEVGSFYSQGIGIVRFAYPNELVSSFDGLVISNNVITMEIENRTYNNGDAPVTGGIKLDATGNLWNVTVSGNIVKNAPVSGIKIRSFSETLGSAVSAQHVRVVDNIIVDAGNNNCLSVADSIHRHAVGVLDRVQDVDIKRNMIYDTGASLSACVTGAGQPNGLYSFYVQPTSPSPNIRTSQNTVRAAAGALRASQSLSGQIDATTASDVQILQISGASTAIVPDFMSFTQYITTINTTNGQLTVQSPLADATGTQWTVGQVVTFRFLCGTGSGGCSVHFADPPYSTSGDLAIDSGKGRAITFQVEKWPSDSAAHKFFELYGSPPGGIPNL